MKFQVTDFAKDRVVYKFSECRKEELENKINLFFTAEGYAYKGEKENGKIYSKGNQFLRVLLGAFWKFFKMRVEIRQNNDQFEVMVKKDASGLMGGAVGMRQVSKEFQRLGEAFKVYFA